MPLEKLVELLPTVEKLGLNKPTDGPPVPTELNVHWPTSMSKWMKEHWPGVPIPRRWGEETIKHLPLGLGKGVQKVVDSLGL